MARLHRAGPPRKIALFTTVYPGVERFLADWYGSVQGQTDQDFELWIASDALTEHEVAAAIGIPPAARWAHGDPGDTPADIRNRALAQIVETCDAVILVDSDDILLPTRVAAARQALAGSDLAGCALRLVDAAGRELGETFASIDGPEARQLLPRWNAFGFSNTAYRADLLKQCLPVPRHARLIDWLVATRASFFGASLSFDPAPQMLYRRHGANTASALGPFTPDRIVLDTQLVLEHFELMIDADATRWHAVRSKQMRAMHSGIADFQSRIVADAPALHTYTAALQALDLPPVWWTSVAHPALSHLWN